MTDTVTQADRLKAAYERGYRDGSNGLPPLSDPRFADGGAATPMRETGTASSVGAGALAHLESEARRFAGFYEPNSDMANTLNILGNKIAALALSATPAPTCDDCGDSGELFAHSDDCDSDFCALAGGMDDCNGQVVPCHCATPAQEVDETERLRSEMQRALTILERNLHRQNEKCDDAVRILRRALAPEGDAR